MEKEVKRWPSSLEKKRVLTVGDGNFSYSLAFAKQYQQQLQSSVDLVATSYDSYAELIEKYPEAKRICQQLRELGVRVLHRVDATNLRVSLEQAIEQEINSSDGDVAAQQQEQRVKFDTIIFNHPHCGEENVQRHQSLLSHFYTSAIDILRTDSGEIHLTLAAGQPERWEAHNRATRAGLKLKQMINDVDNHPEFGLQYERKRHQSGRSFHRITLHGEKKEQESILSIFIRQLSLANVGQEEIDKAVTTKSDTVQDGQPRKRKAQAALAIPFDCPSCKKSFRTAQGVKTHVHMVHELGEDGASQSKMMLVCRHCDRTFKNEDALRQHQLAKHGQDPLIRPDWYQKTQTSDPPITAETTPSATDDKDTESLQCEICLFSFSSRTQFDEHWQKLKPRTTGKLTCATCDRVFDEERALRQHQNFCTARLSTAETLEQATA